MDIDPLFDVNVYIEDKKLIYKFTYKGLEITDLRMLKTIEVMKGALETLKRDDVINGHFVFVVDNITIPTNYSLLKDFAHLFYNYTELITQKVQFTVVQSQSSIFNMFFSLFKQFYKPVKPLYLTTNDKETEDCIKDPEYRKTLPNVSNMVKDKN